MEKKEKNRAIRVRMIVLAVLMIASLIFLNLSVNSSWWNWKYSNTEGTTIYNYFYLSNEHTIINGGNGSIQTLYTTYSTGKIAAVSSLQPSPNFIMLINNSHMFIVYSEYFTVLTILLFIAFSFVSWNPKYAAIFALIAMILLAFSFFYFTLYASNAISADNLHIPYLTPPSGSIYGNDSNKVVSNGTEVVYQLQWYPGLGYIYGFITLLIDISVTIVAFSYKEQRNVRKEKKGVKSKDDDSNGGVKAVTMLSEGSINDTNKSEYCFCCGAPVSKYAHHCPVCGAKLKV